MDQIEGTKKMVNSILATPVRKERNATVETSNQKDSKRRSTRLANKPKSDLTMEQQATKIEFRNQFVAPLVDDTVTNYREVFGLLEEGGVDTLAALVINAEA